MVYIYIYDFNVHFFVSFYLFHVSFISHPLIRFTKKYVLKNKQEKPSETKKQKKDENGAAEEVDDEEDGEEVEDEEYDLPYGEDDIEGEGDGKCLYFTIYFIFKRFPAHTALEF